MDDVNLWSLYELMLRSRLFEEAIKKLWDEGKIFGEMHMGIGEEAIMAGICSQLIDGDAIAMDHRGTSPCIMRGVNPVELLLELLGHSQGLCSGNGGHMHLFSKDLLLASSGIVGSSGPAAVGFALASQYKKKNNIAVAFFGEGAINQGMLLESMNLASVWKLPVLFMCKDNNISLFTQSDQMRGGSLIDRARGFGIAAEEVDGMNAEIVWGSLNRIIGNMRKKSKPFFIHAHCIHKNGHFLGDSLLRGMEKMGEMTKPLMKALVSKKGSGIGKRIGSLRGTLSLISKSRAQTKKGRDPLIYIEKNLKNEKDKLLQVQSKISRKIDEVVKATLEIYQRRDIV